MSFRTRSPQVSWCSEEESLGALQDLRKTSTKAGHASHWHALIHADPLQWPMFICEVWNIWNFGTLRFDISELTNSCISVGRMFEHFLADYSSILEPWNQNGSEWSWIRKHSCGTAGQKEAKWMTCFEFNNFRLIMFTFNKRSWAPCACVVHQSFNFEHLWTF